MFTLPSHLYDRFSVFRVGELVADIEAGPEGQKAGARLLSIIDDPLPFGKVVNE